MYQLGGLQHSKADNMSFSFFQKKGRFYNLLQNLLIVLHYSKQTRFQLLQFYSGYITRYSCENIKIILYELKFESFL